MWGCSRNFELSGTWSNSTGVYALRANPINRLKGFNLIEMVIVMAILSILAAIAIPLYSQYYERGKISQGLAALSGLSIDMAKARLDYQSYVSGSDCRAQAPGDRFFNYTCNGTADSYTWTASSKDGNYVYTIDQNQTRATTLFAGNTLTGVNCWQIGSSGECY